MNQTTIFKPIIAFDTNKFFGHAWQKSKSKAKAQQ